MPKEETTRNLDLKESMILYGLSAGRCNICNQSVIVHPLLKTVGNMGQRAHIVDHSEAHGARGKSDLSGIDLEKFAFRVIDTEQWDTGGIENIILLCHPCHWNADKMEPKEWPIKQLLEYKKQHEERILEQTEANKKTFLVQYYSMIGEFNPKASQEEIRRGLTRIQRFEEESAFLGDTNRTFADHQDSFWTLEEATLVKQYGLRVVDQKEGRSFNHVSVCAAASQPLLIKLGSLLGSMQGVDVLPMNRDKDHPWGWYEVEPHTFKIEQLENAVEGEPVVFIRVSGSQTTSDIQSIKDYLGKADLDVYAIELDGELKPGNGWHVSDNDTFRKVSLELINRIHQRHGNKLIHVFPAMPNHLSVEFGRASLEKVHPPMVIHDANFKTKIWMRAITIKK